MDCFSIPELVSATISDFIFTLLMAFKNLPNEKLINTLENSLNNYTVKLFLGTWCCDSKREVPRFYKVLDVTNFPEAQLEVIAALQNSIKKIQQAKRKG